MVALGVCAADLGFVEVTLLAVDVGRFAEEAAAAPPLLGGTTIRKSRWV
jgi:hypothetical protein